MYAASAWDLCCITAVREGETFLSFKKNRERVFFVSEFYMRIHARLCFFAMSVLCCCCFSSTRLHPIRPEREREKEKPEGSPTSRDFAFSKRNWTPRTGAAETGSHITRSSIGKGVKELRRSISSQSKSTMDPIGHLQPPMLEDRSPCRNCGQVSLSFRKPPKHIEFPQKEKKSAKYRRP